MFRSWIKGRIISGISLQILIISTLCLGAGETSISSERDIKYTAQELIEKIIESENKIKDVQAEYLFYEPDTNRPILYAHWAYQPDKELIAGIGFRQAESNLGYSISTKYIFSLDEEQRFYNYRNEIQKGFKQLLIHPAKLFDLNMFAVYMTPNSLLGFGFIKRFSFGQALQQAKKVTITEKTEKIHGHNCSLLEAVGIMNPECGFDVRLWIDIGRDFRPLRVESFYNNIGGVQYRPFERLNRIIHDIKLKKIDGIWFPIEGKRDNFKYEVVLPPELKGLTEEQVQKKFSEKDLEKIEQKIKEVAVQFGSSRKIIVDVNSIRMNQGIESEKFIVKPPPGCDVWDEIEDKHYTVENGGGTHLEFEVSYSKLKRFTPQEFMKVIYPDTLIDCSLQDLNQFKIFLDSDQLRGKPLLFCIWDMQQRSSRAFIKELAGRSKSLQRQGLAIVGIQASNLNESVLKEWITINDIPFQIIISETNEQHTQLSCAAKSLPWLILTDRKHVVIAEGFSVSEIGDKIK